MRITILIVVVFLARGGWQLRPLTTIHAFTGDNKLNSLVLSAPFSVYHFLISDITSQKKKDWVIEKKAFQNTQLILKDDKISEVFINDKFPLYRKYNFKQSNLTNSKKNIVILVMESWGGSFISTLGGKFNEATPYFNKLSQSGLLFNNFYSLGRRSIQGMSAILFSLNYINELPIYKTPYNENKMSGLASILNNNGYQTTFLHGGELGTFFLHDLAKIAGYKKIFADKDIPDFRKKLDKTWGIWDHFALDFLLEILDNEKTPFHSLFLSLSSHSPYNVPNPKFNYFSEDIEYFRYLNALRYSDWALEQFFEKAKKKAWYKDTIFIITADHSRAIFGNFRDDFNIPLLIFSPSERIKATSLEIVGSQVDILPTVMALLKINSPFASAGKIYCLRIYQKNNR